MKFKGREHTEFILTSEQNSYCFLAAVEALVRPSIHRLIEQVRSMVARIARKGNRVFLEWK